MSRLRDLSAPEARKILVLGGLAALANRRERTGGPTELTFASPEHERFYHSEAPELVASGWMGAGKSRVLCQKAWDLALAHPGSELGLFRKVGSSLIATTERTFWTEVVDPHDVRERNKSEHWVDVGRPGAKPSRIWFLGLDADPVTGVPSKVGSLNLDWAGVDEAVELTEADWIMLGGRLRRLVIPYRQLAAATNPAHPGHWLKRRFTPPSPSRAWITITKNDYLPPDYLERLGGLGDGVHAKRLGQGLWVAAEGTIWELPEAQIAEPSQTDWDRIVAGIDWGYNHPFACEVVAQSGSGRMATLAELYVRGRLVEDLIPELLALQERYDLASFYADPSEPEYIAHCERAGLRIRPATNAVRPGIDAVAAAIKAGETVSPSCVGLLGELPGYVWATDRSGGPREAPVELGDDACDAWRYAHMGLLVPGPGAGLSEYYRHELRDLRARTGRYAR